MKTFPTLIVENLGGAELGRCYYSVNFKVKSLNRMLSSADIEALRKMGVLGYGQEFHPKWIDETEAADAYNKYYVVLVETYCDSSD